MILSPENKALVEGVLAPLTADRRLKGDGYIHIAECALDRLLDAARAEGLEQGRDEAAELAAGEDI